MLGFKYYSVLSYENTLKMGHQKTHLSGDEQQKSGYSTRVLALFSFKPLSLTRGKTYKDVFYIFLYSKGSVFSFQKTGKDNS